MTPCISMRLVTVTGRRTQIPRTCPMSISPARFTALLALLLALACLIAPPALAQAIAGRTVLGGQPDRSAQPTATFTTVRRWDDPAIATLMLVENLGAAGARAVVIRRPGEMPRNIILVTRDTRPADLAQAMSALIVSRDNRGDSVTREMRALIGAAAVGTPPTGRDGAPGKGARASKSPSEPLASRDLRRLAAAPIFHIPGVGRGPALVIRMKSRTKASKD